MILVEEKEQGLAAIYARLVSAPSRRTLGTFFTPSPEVDWMISEWSRLHKAPHAVIDVGAGVGAYTAAAATRWPEAGIWAVDVNPVTLGLLAVRVVGQFELKTSDDEQPGVRLALDDFTRWMSSVWPRIRGPRLILGNPPYTRLQLLPQRERDRLHEAGGGLCGRRASLSTLIAAQSLLALGPDDGMSLLLPAHWLEAEYAKGLRKELWASQTRKVTMRLFDDGLFDDARVDAVALTVGPVQESPQPLECRTDNITPTFATMQRDDAVPAEFRSLFTSSQSVSVEGGVCLGDALEVRRGTATGANAFFALTAGEAEELRLPVSVLRPLVRRTFAVPDRVTKEWLEARPRSERHVLLDITADDLALSSELRSYVKSGEDQELPARHLCRARRDWRVLGSEIVIPDLLIGQSTRSEFRILENTGGAAILNNLYGLTWRHHVSAGDRKRVLHWLRSDAGQRALRAGARSHGSGLWKIEPGAVKKVRIPAKMFRDTTLH
ncbi:hypothetical protein ACIQTX_14510 [Microbacterium sp. NPDC090281]|uniref:hypothetical protein n=1 Tax=Microbacterium sp. NPDC090281 TaxID=3364208 RepID=UPI00380C234D